MSKRYLQWGYDSFKDTKTGEISDNHIHLLNQQAEQISELEEQLKNAITLPVKIGDKIYVVPSETNFKINNIHHKERNRIYEWEVHEIRFSKYGYAVVSWIDNIPFFCVDVETGKYDCGTYKTERFYGETWFKTKEEAQAKLQQMKGNNYE